MFNELSRLGRHLRRSSQPGVVDQSRGALNHQPLIRVPTHLPPTTATMMKAGSPLILLQPVHLDGTMNTGEAQVAKIKTKSTATIQGQQLITAVPQQTQMALCNIQKPIYHTLVSFSPSSENDACAESVLDLPDPHAAVPDCEPLSHLNHLPGASKSTGMSSSCMHTLEHASVSSDHIWTWPTMHRFVEIPTHPLVDEEHHALWSTLDSINAKFILLSSTEFDDLLRIGQTEITHRMNKLVTGLNR